MHIDKLAIEELRLLVLLYKTHSLKDSAVRLNVSTPTARRLLAREGERYSGFTARWIPLEEGYFAKFQIEQTVDFILDTTC